MNTAWSFFCICTCYLKTFIDSLYKNNSAAVTCLFAQYKDISRNAGVHGHSPCSSCQLQCVNYLLITFLASPVESNYNEGMVSPPPPLNTPNTTALVGVCTHSPGHPNDCITHPSQCCHTPSGSVIHHVILIITRSLYIFIFFSNVFTAVIMKPSSACNGIMVKFLLNR